MFKDIAPVAIPLGEHHCLLCTNANLTLKTGAVLKVHLTNGDDTLVSRQVDTADEQRVQIFLREVKKQIKSTTLGAARAAWERLLTGVMMSHTVKRRDTQVAPLPDTPEDLYAHLGTVMRLETSPYAGLALTAVQFVDGECFRFLFRDAAGKTTSAPPKMRPRSWTRGSLRNCSSIP